jgi:ATP-dependent DNA helicase RecG
MQLLEAARNRFKFEELFLLQLRINRMRGLKQTAFRGHSFEKVGDLFNGFYHHSLPFELTEAQKQVIREIRKDVLGGKQMNRLLQGDVGSGKTVVALMTMLLAADNGAQSALMAPTEILAFQHFESIRDLLGDLPVEVRLLTGSTTKRARAEILEGLRNGQVKILVGTHALLEGDVQFQQLGMVVIDEQHRFGVAQRAKLWGKGNPVPHVLVMTATPIPRTLAMTAYGDLDQSVIGELPKGRKPIRTVYKRDGERPSVMQFVKEQIDAGRQAYFVFPLIEESEKLELKDLMAGFDMVSDWFPTPRYQLSIVHGKMKPEQKEAEMQRFKRGASQVMVATTVIEVGVNVPNASVMVIQDADRFGLSQLHQLRGRVGRGAEQSYCILMSREGISEHARKRIDTMCRTNDGFEIARVDMELRGPGDIEGTRQSGMLDLKVADLIKDEDLLETARLEAVKLLNADPDLLQEAHRPLLFKLVARQGGNIWNRVL